MRKISVNKIKDAVSELCIKANIDLREDIQRAIKKALKQETHSPTRRIFSILLENAEIAKEEKRAICQDTGLVSVYISIGQDVKLIGGDLNKAINNGVKEAYRKGYLRKSVVKSPLSRINTATNAPSVIDTEIVKGNKVKITVVPKGFGSENKSALKTVSYTHLTLPTKRIV